MQEILDQVWMCVLGGMYLYNYCLFILSKYPIATLWLNFFLFLFPLKLPPGICRGGEGESTLLWGTVTPQSLLYFSILSVFVACMPTLLHAHVPSVLLKPLGLQPWLAMWNSAPLTTGHGPALIEILNCLQNVQGCFKHWQSPQVPSKTKKFSIFVNSLVILYKQIKFIGYALESCSI